MILTEPDASSLAKSLAHWEYAEYFSCSLVALGCAGEYVAEFTNWWTDGLGEKKHRLAKGSTLLLVCALAFELVCLMKTNTISGLLVGSLADKAAAADTKAQAALTKSSLAGQKADEATAAATDALGKSAVAQDAASGARKEVNAVAKRALEIDSDLAQTQMAISARGVRNPNNLVEQLRQFKGQAVNVTSYVGDDESWALCTVLAVAAGSAGMNPVDLCGTAPLTVPMANTVAISGPDIDETLKLGAIITNAGNLGTTSGMKAPVLTIFVGVKAPYAIGRWLNAPTKKTTNPR